MAQMATPRIKICGIKSSSILDQLIKFDVDYVGFVHFEKSPRHLSLDKMAELAAHARGKINSVTLLVDPDDALLRNVAERVQPDYIQLHGHETKERVKQIRDLVGDIKLIKALPVSTHDDLSAFAAYDDVADLILLDSRPPKGAVLPGGRGEAFEWALVKNLDPEATYMLSGGLDMHNVVEAIRQTGAFAVDVSSGVEKTRGEKDTELIEQFVLKVRSL